MSHTQVPSLLSANLDGRSDANPKILSPSGSLGNRVFLSSLEKIYKQKEKPLLASRKFVHQYQINTSQVTIITFYHNQVSGIERDSVFRDSATS